MSKGTGMETCRVHLVEVGKATVAGIQSVRVARARAGEGRMSGGIELLLREPVSARQYLRGRGADLASTVQGSSWGLAGQMS